MQQLWIVTAGQLQIVMEVSILIVLYSMCPRELKYREIGSRQLGILALLCAASGMLLTIAGSVATENTQIISGGASGSWTGISGGTGTFADMYGIGSAATVSGMLSRIVVMVLSMAPGLMILAFSFLTDGKVGQGDAWLFLALGLRLEPMNNYLLCQSSFLLAAMIGLFHRRRELPLVPCVALVMSVQVMGQILEMAGG